MAPPTSDDPKGMNKKPKMSLFDLEEQFAFYGQYHVNPVNVLIHIICVPIIFSTWVAIAESVVSPHVPSLLIPYSSLLPQSLSPVLQLVETYFGKDLPLNFSTAWAWAYMVYFIILEPLAGFLYAPFLFAVPLFAYHWNEIAPQQTFQYALYGFIFSWIAQFIGHGKFEGRAPALLDNLLQSLVLAVFFVFLEVLFNMGYKPALHKRLQNRIGKEVLKYRQGKKGASKSVGGVEVSDGPGARVGFRG